MRVEKGLLYKMCIRDSTWSVYLITSMESFERLYGKKADRKRKLFNGRIKVDFYQFYGPKPK